MNSFETVESEQQSCITDPEIYPILIKNMGKDTARVLYDIDGNRLKDIDGNYINVYDKRMEDMFVAGSLRLIHNLLPGYRYFITRKQQMDDFLFNRKYGAEQPNLTYCVYEDDDIDKTPRHDHKVIYLSSKRPQKKRPQKKNREVIVIRD